MRPIDADALRDRWLYNGQNENVYCTNDFLDSIDDAPTIEAEPVRHGKWTNGVRNCPICGEDKFKGLDADIWSDWSPRRCPNCGAKMDLDAKEDWQ